MSDAVIALVERVKEACGLEDFAEGMTRTDADRLARIVEMYHDGPNCNHSVKCGPDKGRVYWCGPCRARAIAGGNDE